MKEHQPEHRNARERTAKITLPLPGNYHFTGVLKPAKSHAYGLGLTKHIVGK
jgi:hypothetical protein